LSNKSESRGLTTKRTPPTPATFPAPFARLAASELSLDEREQAEVLLVASGAAMEMGPHPGDRLVGVGSGELKLDVAVELLEALLAAELRTGGAKHAR
jgi:hypothetical protein